MNPRVELLLSRFLTRLDSVAVLAPWGTPCPVDFVGSEEATLLAHLEGDRVPKVTLPRMDEPTMPPLVGRFRIGSYVPDHDGNTCWLGIDIDGAGHSHAVADPLAALLKIKAAFDSHGIPSFVELSGGGVGWHLWVFFDQAVKAAKARQLALALIPRDIPLTDGGFADPDKNRGIEVFPKQTSIAPDGFGNMLWLPWWYGAKGNACQFHSPNGDGALHPYMPESLETITEATLDAILTTLVPPAAGPVQVPIPAPLEWEGGAEEADEAWRDWRHRALDALSLEAVYGQWLTGKPAHKGWVGCRVPWSPTGDQTPSGGVADGTGTAERGAFHDFTSQETISVFDFLIRIGRSKDFKSAFKLVAELSRIGLPTITPDHTEDPPSTNSLGSIRLTELGNARRFTNLHGRDLRFVALVKKWYAWDDRRWHPDDTGEAQRRMKATVRSIYDEATRCDDPEMREKIAKWAIKSEAEKIIRAGLVLAQSEKRVAILPSEFDTDPWLLTCQNGTLDLRTGILREHRREDLITRLARVEHDSSATCPRWEQYLDRVTGGDRELQGFLKRSVGYSLTGDISAQVLFMLYGPGENGKTTFVDTLEYLFGDYALHTPTETLMVKRNSGVPNDLARLAGARLITAVEVEDGHRLSESVIKQWTGGDTITARFLNREFFQFKPCGKIWVAANHKPQITGTDHAIWRRIRLIPFSVRITKEERDDQLPEKLRREMSGILNWALQGCLEWQAEGLKEPSGVILATNEYRSEMDTVAIFLSECCLTGSERSVQSTPLYEAYTGWCEKTHEKTLTLNKFVERMKEKGFVKAKTDGVMKWQGIGILADERTVGRPPGE